MRTALVAGGLAAITFIGALFVYNQKRKIDQIPRQKILQTIKLLRQQMFLSLVEMSNFVKQNASRVPPQHIKTYVLDQQGQYMKSFKQKLSKVFMEFTEEDFQQNINKFYKQDAEVQYHLKKYQQQFEKATLGVTPQFRQEVITFLKPELILNIIKDLLQAKLTRLKQKIKQKITFQQMVIILKAQKEEQKQLRSSKLKEIGLIGKDQQLASIFQFGVAKYCKMDEQFRQKYQQIIEQYKVKSNQHVDRYCSFPRSTSKAHSLNSMKSMNNQQKV